MIISQISEYTNVKNRTIQFYIENLDIKSENTNKQGLSQVFSGVGLCKLIGAVWLYKAGFKLKKIKEILNA